MAWLWVVLSVLFFPTCSCLSMKNHGFTTVLLPLSLSCIDIDDCFLLFKSFDHVSLFLEYLNRQLSKISFTSELEKHGKLPFLDIEISRSNGKFSTSVYCKPTSFHWSFHSLSQLYSSCLKCSLVSCSRARGAY